MSAVTGARRKASTPIASAIALSTAPYPAPTGGSPTPLAPTGVSRIGKVERLRLQLIRDVQDRQRLVVVETPRERDAMLRIDHPLLTQRMRDAEAAAAIELGDQAPWIDDGPDIPDRGGSRRASPFRFGIDLDLCEADDERERVAVARVIVPATPISPSPGGSRRLRHLVHIVRCGVAVEAAAQLDRAASRLRVAQGTIGSAATKTRSLPTS